MFPTLCCVAACLVTITSNPSTTFKGFMCQVRKFNSGDTVAIGMFTSFDTGKAKNLACTFSKVYVSNFTLDDLSAYFWYLRAGSCYSSKR